MTSPDTPPTEAVGDKLRLGGMALGNGLLVHGPTHWAAAVRTRSRPMAPTRSSRVLM